MLYRAVLLLLPRIRPNAKGSQAVLQWKRLDRDRSLVIRADWRVASRSMPCSRLHALTRSADERHSPMVDPEYLEDILWKQLEP